MLSRDLTFQTNPTNLIIKKVVVRAVQVFGDEINKMGMDMSTTYSKRYDNIPFPIVAKLAHKFSKNFPLLQQICLEKTKYVGVVY